MKRSIRWLDRCVAAHARPTEQNLFAIIQGGLDPELRRTCVEGNSKACLILQSLLSLIIIIIIIITIITMGLDCQKFLRTLANKLSTKNNEPYASVISWLRIQLSFAILRTVHRCVRGSRYPFKSREVSEDFTFAVAGLHLHS